MKNVNRSGHETALLGLYLALAGVEEVIRSYEAGEPCPPRTDPETDSLWYEAEGLRYSLELFVSLLESTVHFWSATFGDKAARLQAAGFSLACDHLGYLQRVAAAGGKSRARARKGKQHAAAS